MSAGPADASPAADGGQQNLAWQWNTTWPGGQWQHGGQWQWVSNGPQAEQSQSDGQQKTEASASWWQDDAVGRRALGRMMVAGGDKGGLDSGRALE